MNGTHTLSSKSYDAAGNFGTSAGRTVTVNNAGGDITLPVISNVHVRQDEPNNDQFEIRWTTNEPSTTVVTISGMRYADTALVTSHVCSLRGQRRHGSPSFL